MTYARTTEHFKFYDNAATQTKYGPIPFCADMSKTNVSKMLCISCMLEQKHVLGMR